MLADFIPARVGILICEIILTLPATVALMNAYLEQNGYMNDFNETRLHHEIYMSNARKVPPKKWRTVIRHPIKKA